MNSYPNPAIVLVDDEPAMLGMLHGLVRDLAPGYDVVAVSDGGTAFEHAVVASGPLVTDAAGDVCSSCSRADQS